MAYNYTIIIITTFLVTSAIFNLILYFGFNKNSAYLHFAIFSFLNGIKTISDYTWISNNIPSSDIWIFNISHALSYIISSPFLIAFMLKKFLIPNRKIIFLYFTIIFLPLSIFSGRISLMLLITASFLISLYALRKREEGSLLSLIGLTGFSIWSFLGYINILNPGYFIGILFFVLCMNLSLAKQIALQNKMRNKALIRASRLESQMLKKNIQPHFILNSLTSLQELVEKSPGKAIKFIDSLAEEFQIISKISGEKLIPITDELKICKAHLKIMGYRKEADFKIETVNITGDEMIPPAIFHTLVENGLTHGYESKSEGRFELSKEVLNNGLRYRLFNDGQSSNGDEKNDKGTGFRYVEARLEETYPGRWSLNSEPTDGGWQVVIDILDAEKSRKN